MVFRKWENLPSWMKTPEVKVYYDKLKKKKKALYIKRAFDIFLSAMLILITFPIFIVISLMIFLDSGGKIIFRQKRVTAYGKVFRIHKFRTMKRGSESEGSIIAKDEDERITRVGKKLRKYRLDELPQLFDVFLGDMSFVGPRPQSVEFVKHFDKASRAVFLMPAGITSETTLNFLNEGEMLKGAEDIDDAYIKEILPVKMNMQLEEISKFSMINDLKTMIHTLKR